MPLRRAALLVLALLASCRTSRPAPAEVATRTEPGLTVAPGELPTLDPTALDRAADPCDDFYQFACGGWLARVEIPADKPIWGRGFMELDERNREKLRDILEAAAAGRGDPRDRYSRKIGDYYAACMDEAGIESRGAADLRAAWGHIDAVEDAGSLVRAVAWLHGRGVAALFEVGQVQDAKDAAQVIAQVAQGGLSLPDRDYYTQDDPKNREIVRLWREHVAKMLGLAGAPEPRAQSEAVLRIETALAEPQWTQTELRDPARVYNRVELAGLEKLAPRFDWKAYLAELGIPDVRAITATTPRFLERVNALLEKTPPAEWRSYLRWRLLDQAARARALPRVFVDQSFAFFSAAFTGQEEKEARWKRCVAETDDALGEALGQIYVREYFGADGKDRARRLVEEIEKAMASDVRGLPWMDEETRKKALLKLSRIVNKIGYPDSWRNYDDLAVFRDSYFRSLLAAQAFEVRRQLAKIGKPPDRAEWLMSPPEVNAYYEPPLNEIVFPAGILQPPFFNPAAPSPVNYGAIGIVVGHELTHGFDDEGRKYDAEGNLRDWWTQAAAGEFERRAECVARQFDAYETVPGVRLNGELTLGENLADLGGVKLSFAAMRAALDGKPAPPSLEGFTPEQQFFVGFAQSWCTKMREPFARMMAAVDPHAPAKFRVDGPLSNVPEFAQAFGCRAGSKMARSPAARCAVW